jgi:hypothetical protein
VTPGGRAGASAAKTGAAASTIRTGTFLRSRRKLFIFTCRGRYNGTFSYQFLSRTLSQPGKLFDAETDTPEDRPKGSAIHLFMIGDDHLTERVIAAQNHVTSLLPLQRKSRFLENLQAFTAG